MELKIDRIDELVIDYLLKGLDSPEIDELQAWVEASAENRAYFLARKEIWFSSSSLDDAMRYNVEEAFERFISRIGSSEMQPSRSKRGAFLRLNWMRYAAMVVMIVGALIVGSYYFGRNEMKNHFADIVIEAPMGSQTKLYLPDGTLVWLNAGSKIVYSQGFGIDERTVELTGEAYFEVARNEKLPVTVSSGNLELIVLGTKFNFRNFDDDEEIIVSLLEGKVSLKTEKGDSYILNPNQKAIYNKLSGTMNLSPSLLRRSELWIDGQLFFDEVKFVDIARELQRSYGVKLHFADSTIGDMRFYAMFDRKAMTIAEVMNMLCLTNKISYTIKGKEVKIYRN